MKSDGFKKKKPSEREDISWINEVHNWEKRNTLDKNKYDIKIQNEKTEDSISKDLQIKNTVIEKD